MRTVLHHQHFDTTTPSGLKRAVKFEKENPEYKLLTSRLDFNWIYEKELEEVSNCCSAKVIGETDICSKCKEHCELINI